MQALIILSLIVFHLLDQQVGGVAVDGAWWRSATVPLVILFGPLAIGLQVLWTTRFSTDRSTYQERLPQIVVGFWFLSGLLLIAVLNWGSVLRHQWHLAAWAPLDEIVLFAPLFLSLLLCWAAQFHVEQRLHGSESECEATSTARLRREFIAIRAQVFLLPAIAPLGAVIISQALGNWLAWATGSAAVSTWSNLGFLLVVLAMLPWLFASIWRARRLPDGPLRSSLVATIKCQRVAFRDIRIWPTGNQLTNAMVVGIFPKLRILVLTDRLIRLLNPEELSVVVAHEAGHVRLGHMLTRIWFVLLPLVAFSIVPFLVPDQISQSFVSNWIFAGAFEPLVGIAVASTYAIYAFWVMAWISRKMEFQADLFACQKNLSPANRELDIAATANFCESLIKLAADSGEDVRRSGWLHPSVASRVQFLRRATNCPTLIQGFNRSFARRKGVIMAAIWLSAIAIALL